MNAPRLSAAARRRDARRAAVKAAFDEDPELSDDAVAAGLGVSGQTVLNDRVALGIESGIVRRQKLRMAEAAAKVGEPRRSRRRKGWRMLGDWDTAEVVASCSVCRILKPVPPRVTGMACKSCGRAMGFRAVLS